MLIDVKWATEQPDNAAEWEDAVRGAYTDADLKSDPDVVVVLFLRGDGSVEAHVYEVGREAKG